MAGEISGGAPHDEADEVLAVVFTTGALEDLRTTQAQRGVHIEILPMETRPEKDESAARYGDLAIRVFRGGNVTAIDPMARDPRRWYETARRALDQGGYVVRLTAAEALNGEVGTHTSA